MDLNVKTNESKKVNCVEDMVGFTMSSVTTEGNYDILRFKSQCGRTFELYHAGDCCEVVTIEDISGDLKDLIGSPLLMSEESTNEAEPKVDAESYTWTFYKFATVKGYVTVRWLGTSNGYYSESVDFREVT